MALPTLRQLQFLLAVADEGSFSRAADACHVTQPTLSSGIKELEGILGTQLVEREARGARLSAAGEIAVERARKVLAEAMDLSAAVREASAPLTGDFRLGAIPTIAPFVLPRTLSYLREQYPDLRLHVREDLTERLLDMVRARKLDAALIALPFNAPGIETEAIAEDEFLLVADDKHPLTRKNGLMPSDLDGEKVLLLEDGHCLRDHALSICRLPETGEAADVAATSLHTLVQMVASGLGVSLLPRLAASSNLTSGTNLSVRPFAEPVIGRSIGMAWRSGSAREKEARMIGEAVKSAVAI